MGEVFETITPSQLKAYKQRPHEQRENAGEYMLLILLLLLLELYVYPTFALRAIKLQQSRKTKKSHKIIEKKTEKNMHHTKERRRKQQNVIMYSSLIGR